MASYKIAFLGNGGVGKSVFIQRHLDGEFEPRYLPTSGIAEKTLCFATNHGTVQFTLLDVAGQEQFSHPKIDADAYIVMFDVTSKVSFKSVNSWLAKIANKSAPIVIAGTKVDIVTRSEIDGQVVYTSNRKVSLKMLQEAGYASSNEYYNISARSNYNFEKPFLHIARKLTGHADLVFVAI